MFFDYKSLSINNLMILNLIYEKRVDLQLRHPISFHFAHFQIYRGTGRLACFYLLLLRK